MATLTFALFCSIGTSSPGFAMELNHTGMVSPMLTLSVTNLVIPGSVPSIEPTVTAETLAAAEPAVFDTLDAAVAAQDAVATDASDILRCLAGAIYFESKGEPLSGQLAVAQVIMNRAKSGRFPPDVCAVVKQRGQFSFVRGGEMPVVDAGRRGYRVAVAVAKVAMAEMWDGPAPKALFFHARRVAPGWGMTRVAAIGNHVFYR